MPPKKKLDLTIRDDEGNILLTRKVAEEDFHFVRGIIPDKVDRSMIGPLEQLIDLQLEMRHKPDMDITEKEKYVRVSRLLRQDLGFDEAGESLPSRWEDLKERAEQYLIDNGLRKPVVCPSCGQVLQVNLTYFAWMVEHHPDVVEEFPNNLEALPHPFLRDKMMLSWSPELAVMVMRLNSEYGVPWEDLLGMVKDVLMVGDAAVHPLVPQSHMARYLKELSKVDWSTTLNGEKSP